MARVQRRPYWQIKTEVHGQKLHEDELHGTQAILTEARHDENISPVTRFVSHDPLISAETTAPTSYGTSHISSNFARIAEWVKSVSCESELVVNHRKVPNSVEGGLQQTVPTKIQYTRHMLSGDVGVNDIKNEPPSTGFLFLDERCPQCDSVGQNFHSYLEPSFRRRGKSVPPRTVEQSSMCENFAKEQQVLSSNSKNCCTDQSKRSVSGFHAHLSIPQSKVSEEFALLTRRPDGSSNPHLHKEQNELSHMLTTNEQNRCNLSGGTNGANRLPLCESSLIYAKKIKPAIHNELDNMKQMGTEYPTDSQPCSCLYSVPSRGTFLYSEETNLITRSPHTFKRTTSQNKWKTLAKLSKVVPQVISMRPSRLDMENMEELTGALGQYETGNVNISEKNKKTTKGSKTKSSKVRLMFLRSPLFGRRKSHDRHRRNSDVKLMGHDRFLDSKLAQDDKQTRYQHVLCNSTLTNEALVCGLRCGDCKNANIAKPVKCTNTSIPHILSHRSQIVPVCHYTEGSASSGHGSVTNISGDIPRLELLMNGSCSTCLFDQHNYLDGCRQNHEQTGEFSSEKGFKNFYAHVANPHRLETGKNRWLVMKVIPDVVHCAEKYGSVVRGRCRESERDITQIEAGSRIIGNSANKVKHFQNEKHFICRFASERTGRTDGPNSSGYESIVRDSELSSRTDSTSNSSVYGQAVIDKDCAQQGVLVRGITEAKDSKETMESSTVTVHQTIETNITEPRNTMQDNTDSRNTIMESESGNRYPTISVKEEEQPKSGSKMPKQSYEQRSDENGNALSTSSSSSTSRRSHSVPTRSEGTSEDTTSSPISVRYVPPKDNLSNVQPSSEQTIVSKEGNPSFIGKYSEEIREMKIQIRYEKIREILSQQAALKRELIRTKAHLLSDPATWCFEIYTAEQMEPEDEEFLGAIANETEALRARVNACKSRIMLITCFDSEAGFHQPTSILPEKSFTKSSGATRINENDLKPVSDTPYCLNNVH